MRAESKQSVSAPILSISSLPPQSRALKDVGYESNDRYSVLVIVSLMIRIQEHKWIAGREGAVRSAAGWRGAGGPQAARVPDPWRGLQLPHLFTSPPPQQRIGSSLDAGLVQVTPQYSPADYLNGCNQAHNVGKPIRRLRLSLKPTEVLRNFGNESPTESIRNEYLEDQPPTSFPFCPFCRVSPPSYPF